MTTAPIAGNQYFSQVFDQAGHLNLLNVSNLRIGTATTNSLEVVAVNPNLGLGQDSSIVRTLLDGFGHIIPSQVTEPLATLGVEWVQGSTVELLALKTATDAAGEIFITGAWTGVAGATITITFNRPYPLGTLPVVILTPGSLSGNVTASKNAAFIQSGKNGWHVKSNLNGFTVVFGAIDPGLEFYAIKYQVVGPTPHS